MVLADIEGTIVVAAIPDFTLSDTRDERPENFKRCRGSRNNVTFPQATPATGFGDWIYGFSSSTIEKLEPNLSGG